MKNQMKKILLAVAMVVVVAAGLLVYSSGKTTSMGTAKGFGGDVKIRTGSTYISVSQK